MGFSGWTAEAIEFYEGLEADNSKTYWNENKPVYETCVLRPMTELLAELAPEFGAAKLFRPTGTYGSVPTRRPTRRRSGRSSSSGLRPAVGEWPRVGSGMWMMAPDQLERYRKAVSAETTGQSLADLLSVLRAAGIQAEGTIP